MIKTVIAGAAAAAISLSSSFAAVILIDGFGDAQGPLTVNSGSTSATSLDTVVTDTDLTGVERDLILDFVTDNGFAGDATLEVVSSGSNSFLRFANDPGVESTATINWTFDTTDLTSTTDLVFEILTNDVAGGSFSFTLLDATDTIVSSGAVLLPVVNFGSPLSLSFGLNSALLTSVDELTLIIDTTGTANIDLAIDFVQAVSEPGLIGLLGLGLVGLGVAARRRSA